MSRHYHGPECYPKKLKCNIIPNHKHVPRCRDKDGVVICGIEVDHVHDYPFCYELSDVPSLCKYK